MEEVRRVAFERGLMLLRSTNCKYVVIDEDGQKHVYGDLEIVEPKRHKRKTVHTRPIGAIRNHFTPYVKDLKPRESVTIPEGAFSVKEIQSSLTSWASKVWGPKTYHTQSSELGLHVFRYDTRTPEQIAADNKR